MPSRGTSMSSEPVAFLLADLGVTKTHSRPHLSDDNPHSESQFRTMQYRPEFPDRFGYIQDSGAFSQGSFVGTTKSIAIRAWACSRQQWSITDKLRSSLSNAKRFSMWRIACTRDASCGRHRNLHLFQRRSGSTNHRTEVPRLTKLRRDVSESR